MFYNHNKLSQMNKNINNLVLSFQGISFCDVFFSEGFTSYKYLFLGNSTNPVISTINKVASRFGVLTAYIVCLCNGYDETWRELVNLSGGKQICCHKLTSCAAISRPQIFNYLKLVTVVGDYFYFYFTPRSVKACFRYFEWGI